MSWPTGWLPVISTVPEDGSTATELGCWTVGTSAMMRGVAASVVSITRIRFDAVRVT
ncbi:Uncharacterised protein [Mycobacteroides abscessus subsp. abscessus]|nr:Uncharacterised protein [Mycobacteroides abscessus subsp. abscessus]